MNNGNAHDEDAQLLTVQQASAIVMLMQRIGVDPDASSMLTAQERVGGPSTPHGYLLLSRQQAFALLQMMESFLRHLELEQTREDARRWGVA